MVHDDCISQGVTDSYISVIGHEGQEDALSTPKSKKKKKSLGSTGKTHDVLPSREKVYHHFGNSAADEGQVPERKLAEQKVHRGVELHIHPYQEEQDTVPSDGSEVDQKDHVDEDAGVLHIGKESQRRKSAVHVSFPPFMAMSAALGTKRGMRERQVKGNVVKPFKKLSW